MINYVFNIVLLILSIFTAWFSYTSLVNINQIIVMFIAGVFFGLFLMNLRLIVKDKKIGTYQRQLEKESISSDENAAKVKVLESKIEVLERALENALGNK